LRRHPVVGDIELFDLWHVRQKSRVLAITGNQRQVDRDGANRPSSAQGGLDCESPATRASGSRCVTEAIRAAYGLGA